MQIIQRKNCIFLIEGQPLKSVSISVLRNMFLRDIEKIVLPVLIVLTN